MPELALPLVVTVTFLLGLLARWTSLPPMVGFLAAGFVLHALGQRTHAMIEHAADFGVTLLMFTIGLKLRLSTLARPAVWAGATVHMVATVVFVAVCLTLFGAVGLSAFAGIEVEQALLLGFSLSFSSTVFAVKVLESRRESASGHGRVAIGILIMQDILAVLFLAFSLELPRLSGQVCSLDC